jgi:pyridoxal phosphate enzyme (YggS family)
MLEELLTRLRPRGARLVAVSKAHSPEEVMRLYERGQRDFGENKVQELTPKYEALPKDIRWHFIGHLQRNKVKYIAPFVALIHSVDSERLLEEIDKQAARNDRVIDCLLEFKIAGEDTKHGFQLEEARRMLAGETYNQMRHVRLLGVMGMATFTDDDARVRGEFSRLREIFEALRAEYFARSDAFRELSMGMSDDYPIALEEGSTMVRIGTLLFGKR